MYEKNWLILSSRVMGVARWKALSIFPVLLMGSEKWCFPEEWIPRVPARHQDSTHYDTQRQYSSCLQMQHLVQTRRKEMHWTRSGVGAASSPSLVPCQENIWLSFCWREFLHGYVERSASHTWANVITGDPTVSGVLKSVKINWNGFNHENIFRMSGCLLLCLGLVPFSPPAQFIQSLPIHFF